MRTLRRASTGICVLAFCFVVAMSGALLAAPFYPEPEDNINDYVGLLTAEEKERLEALADELWEKTGVAVAVAIIRTTEEESIKMYAVKLYEKWGIGARGDDRGLLLVVAVDDRKVTMEVGYGLEPVITDARAGRCLDEMTPYFKENKYGEGIYKGLLKASGYIAEDAGAELTPGGAPVLPGEDTGSSWFLRVVLPAVVTLGGIVALGASLRSALRPKCPRCGARLVTLDRVVEKATFTAGGLAATLYRCTRCGYSREKLYKTPPLARTNWGFPGTGRTMGPGPWFGGFGGSSKRGGSSGPTGFGGGRSGGGGATRGW